MTAVLSLTLLLRVQVRAQVPENPLPSAPVARTLLTKPTMTRLAANGQNAPSASAQQDNSGSALSLYTVVDLALRNSHIVRMREADAARARGSYLETRNAYIPNFSVGSGLGYSYGFPLGNPTLFNVTSTSLLFSFSQHDYIRSTNEALKAATLAVKSARQQVILDATLNYIELDKTNSQIAALDEAVADSDKMIAVVKEREKAGMESAVGLTRARLTRAQIRLRALQLQDHADELRQHLAGLTGLAPDAIAPASSSIPQLPGVDLRRLQADGSKDPNVQAAFATAESKRFNAIGDKNQNYRPTVGMASQYARFAPFNGYSYYYQHFTYNNIGIGIQAVWPLFDPIRRDKAIESKAEAIRARQQARQTRIQVDESNVALWHSLRELEAQEQVAELEQQLAQDTLNSSETQMNQGSATPGGSPVTPQQADEDLVKERTSYVDLRDAQFNVTRVKLNLLNAVGGLESWAKESADLGNGSISITPQVVQH